MDEELKGSEKMDTSEGEALSQETFSIFILKSQPTVLVQAESFLRNRKWVVGSSTKLKEALAYIIQKQPQYVFLSVDHPHKKVKILPKLLAQAFPCRVIAFAERGGPLSMSVMNEMALEYNLYPPVSGPSIQRLILKIRKDDELRAKGLGADGKPLAESKQEGSSTMTFKADGQPDSGEFSFDARSALSQLLAGEAGDGAAGGIGGMSGPSAGAAADSAMAQGSSPQGNMAYTGNMGQQGPGSGVGQAGMGYTGSMGQASGAGQSGMGYMGGMGGPNTSGGMQGPPGGANGRGGLVGPNGETGPADGESFDAWAERMRKAAEEQARAQAENPNGQSGSGAQGAQNASGYGDQFPSGIDANDPTGLNRGSAGKSLPTMESDYKRKEKKRGYRIESDPRYNKNEGRESIIVRGTQQALDETVNLKGDPAEEVAKATNVACILVQGPRFSGYLVCAMGADRKVDNNLLETIQNRLFSFLKANGEELKEDELIDMKIQEVDFQDWALEQADFLRKSVHDGDEIAIAFFPAGNLEVRLEESASRKMLQMKLEELRDDTPLEFDLYIYMPENNKYLLYTPEGMPIYGKQKVRLQERGVTHMHLKKESVQGVKKYRAQNFLNDKIASYKMAQKMKS